MKSEKKKIPNHLFQMIITIIYYLLGKDTYKVLKSYPDLINTICKVSNTLRVLIETSNNDVPIKQHHTHNEYKFFKSNLFDIISIKYVVLNDGFSKQAITRKDARIIDYKLDIQFINQFILEKFNLLTVVSEKDLSLIDKYLNDVKRNGEEIQDKIMTPQEWNLFWSEIIDLSHKDKALDNLDCRGVCLSEIPGALTVRENVYLSQVWEEGICEREPDGYSIDGPISIDPDTEQPMILDGRKFLHDFKNETSYPLEFAIIKGVDKRNSNIVGLLSTSKYDCTESTIFGLFDIHSYLFSDI